MSKIQKITISILLFLSATALSLGLLLTRQVHPIQSKVKIAVTTMTQVKIFDRLGIDLVAVPTPAKSQGTLPKRYAKLPQIGNHAAPNLENLVLAHPSIVYLDSSIASDYTDKLQENHIKGQALDMTKLDNLKTAITQIGKTYQKNTAAKKLIQSLILPKNKLSRHPKVLLLIGMPGGGFLQGTKYSYIGDLIRQAGGDLVTASNNNSPYSQLNTELIVNAQPDLIITMAHAMPVSVFKSFNTLFQSRPWSELMAVKNHQIFEGKTADFTMTANLDALKTYQTISNWLTTYEKNN